MPCWIKSAQVLYILSVLTNYSHEFAQEVLQQERSFAAQKILIDTLESAGFHLILFMLVQNISYHHPVIVFNTSPCALNNLLETRSYPFHFSFSSQPRQDICSLLRQMLLGQSGWIDLRDLICHTKSSISAVAQKKRQCIGTEILSTL